MSKKNVSLKPGSPTGVTWRTSAANQPLWVIAGELTDFQRISAKGRPLNRSATFKEAVFTHLPGVMDILTEVGLSDLAESAEVGLPPEIESLQLDFKIRIKEMLKVGKTVNGSQLLKITRLPAHHKPVVLGIPRSMPSWPFIIHNNEYIAKSLGDLTHFLASGNVPDVMQRFGPFYNQVRNEAMQDSGHLISLALGVLASIRTG